jgi:DNA end-binding protein Ku
MPRSIWSGVISFGMVSIPVKLYTATESKDVSFHLLHRECRSRLKQLRWCPACERKAPWEESGRGYEYARDQHVLLDEDDFEKLPLPSKRAVQLSAFVPARGIDAIHYERSYYLEPEKTGVKPFALLMRALTKKRLVAVAKIAIRSKEQLCCLRPYAGALLLETMFYADEIRVKEDSEQRVVKVSKQELGMAFTFIDLLSEPFDPAKYSDGYRQALRRC